MAKKEYGTFYRLGLMNSKMSNDFYKAIMKKCGGTKMSIKQFKTMFHSKYTKPEVRAILLSSLYTNDQPNLRELEILGGGKKQANLDIVAARRVNDWFFRIEDTNVSKGHSQKAYKLNQDQIKHIQALRPLMLKKDWLTRALMTENVHTAKIALLFNEVHTWNAAFTDMLEKYIRLNDPEQRFFDTSEEDYWEDYIDSITKPASVNKANMDIFLRDLTHMRNEFAKFIPTLQKLGIDTSSLEARIDADLDRHKRLVYANEYYTEEAISDGERLDPREMMYENFEQLIQTLGYSYNLYMDIARYDFNSPKARNLRRLDIIPEFVDYNPDKYNLHRERTEEGKSIEAFYSKQFALVLKDRNKKLRSGEK